MPEPQNLHVNQVLTNLSIKYRNERMIWRDCLPIVPVGKRSDLFYKRNKEDAFKVPDDTLGPKGLPNEVEWSNDTENYSVKDHGLADWVTQEEIENADNPLQPKVETNENLNEGLDNAQEVRTAGIVFNAATYPAGNKVQLSGTAQWGESADDPIGDIMTVIESCFYRANTLVFGVDAWIKFRQLPEILDEVKGSTRYQGSPGGLATAPEVAGLFEVDRILIGRARKITSKPGQTATYARIWGKHCAALYAAPSPGIKTISMGYIFVETERITKEVFDGKRGVKGATFVKVAWNSDEKIVASDCGYFIQDAVA